MGFRKKLQYFLVHQQKLSNKAAKELILSGKVYINNKPVFENCLLNDNDEISIQQQTVRPGKEFILMKYYKPVGKVSSLNPGVNDSLYERFKDYLPLCIVGRLDKNSEGLLLLTNHGKWAHQITHPSFEKEKTYEVKVNKPINDLFLQNMRNGIEIMGVITKPAKCKAIDEFHFEIKLTEGKNRQIRRMCRKQGYRVLVLKRISVGNYHLSNLGEDEFEMLNFT